MYFTTGKTHLRHFVRKEETLMSLLLLQPSILTTWFKKFKIFKLNNELISFIIFHSSAVLV